MRSVVALLPAWLIRGLGRWQFRIPLLRRVLSLAAGSLAGDGVIQRGAGKGLYFNARGCNPGYLTGTSEPLEQELIVRYSTAGSVVYDVGANAGYYAVLAAKAVGPEGWVYAFEPTPTLAERIRSNAARNHFHHVEVIEMAVTNVDGTVEFGIVGALSVNNSIHAASAIGSTPVKATRLDTFCKTHQAPDLILIDIEGAEIDALEGALGTIRSKRPVIMVEVHWRGDAFPAFVTQHLLPLGYTATTYEGKPLPSGIIRYHALLLPGKEIGEIAQTLC